MLDRFCHTHTPTAKNRQGLDFGSQYRSVIFFHDDEQKATALASRDAQDRSGEHRKKIVTEILPAPRVLAGRGVPPAVLREERDLGVPVLKAGSSEPGGCPVP